MNDISPAFRWNPYDATVAAEMAERAADPARCLRYFCEKCAGLTDYAYWFLLSTLWVLDASAADLATWRRLFSSTRNNRSRSIMKPSELNRLKQLPWFITAYRAHRADEADWIAYTTDITAAKLFACLYGVRTVDQYTVKKRYVRALFLRRGESEIIVTERERAEFVKTIRLENLQ